MTFLLTIDMDNAAFSDGRAFDEVARILVKLAKELETASRTRFPLFDFNGNKVGVATVTQ